MRILNQSRSHGFTLLEIMIALSIAAMMMAIGIPSFVKASRKEGLRKAVSDLVEGCSEARSQSILRGVVVELVIEAAERRISVAVVPPDEADIWGSNSVESGAKPESLPSAQISKFSRVWPEQVGFKQIWVKFENLIDASEARIRFYPNGTGDEFTATLISAEGETIVSVDVVTGLANSAPAR